MANEKIIVQLASPERYYTKCYHDFMDCNLLNGEEKIVFLALKRFLDVKSEQGKVFPTIETIQDMTCWGNQKVVKYIKSLVKKGVVKKIRQGLSKPNIYILADYPTMWTCDTVEDMAAVADNQGMKPLTPAEHIAELERMGYTVQIKEKGPDNEPTKVHYQAPQFKPFNIANTTTNSNESQDLERYTLDQIKQLFNYDIMIQDNPYQQQDIDSVMNILYKTMNTNKPTIRISGQDKPAMVVICNLMKLNKESITYAIEKFSEQTDRIKNSTAYMLTILFYAPEQYHFDIKNQVAHDHTHGKLIVSKNLNANKKTNYAYSYDNSEKELFDINKTTENDNLLQEEIKNMLEK